MSLQDKLAKNLLTTLEASGSTMFRYRHLTVTTPGGRQVCAIKASALRTSGSGFTSWPRPEAHPDAPNTGTNRGANRGGARARLTVQGLGPVAQSSNLPTPKSSDADRGGMESRMGRKSNLVDRVMTASWSTPGSRDWKDSAGMSENGTNPDGTQRTRLDQLPRQAALSSWATQQREDSESPGAHRGKADSLHSQTALAGWNTPTGLSPATGNYNAAGNSDGLRKMLDQAQPAAWPTPNVPNGGRVLSEAQTLSMKSRGGDKVQAGLENVANLAQPTVSGATPNGLPAATVKAGRLNPALPRWLQGLPKEWDEAAIQAWRSMPTTRARRA